MAIQVNGTTVIDNSRALTNISSVDSSVVSAMSSAGVGGATSLITDWTNVPSSSNWSISLSSSYDIIRVYFDKVGANTNGGVYQYSRLQYSGGTETGNDYIHLRESGTAGVSNSIIMGDVQGVSSSTPAYTSGFYEVRFHGDSSKWTQFLVNTISSYNSGTSVAYANTYLGSLRINRAHTSLLLTTLGSQTFYGGKYKVIGVSV